MPFLRQTVLDEIHRSADPVSLIVSLAEMNRQDYLRELGAHSQKGGNPHPEYRTRSSDGDRAGNTCDISCSDRSRQCSTYCLEGRHRSALRLLFVKHFSQRMLNRVDKASDLNKPGSDAQIQADADNADHRRDAPDETVHYSIY